MGMGEQTFTVHVREAEEPTSAGWIIEALTNIEPGCHPPFPEEWGYSETEQGAALWAERLNRAYELGRKLATDGGFGNG